MAEVKNSFLGSKMNQDLDDRLIPSNEYREGLNISVSNSEQNDVGAMENILGNNLLASATTNDTIIGYFVNEANDSIYLFTTDHDNFSQFAPQTADCKVHVYNTLTKTLTTLLQGSFLNFSKTHPIYGVNMLEDLLFWTDNRNQPRKINVQTAFNDNTYYSTEDHVSVAKYAPFRAIEMFEETSPGSGTYKTTMKDVSSVKLPDGTTDNPDYNADYPGDADFIHDKFVRFSYRFQFDDGEYSIMAPFTQIAFIPRQDGSFIDKYNTENPPELVESDEDDAYKSTVVKFMENKVNNIKLIIPLEYQANELNDKLKVSKIEILYKESDSNAIKVVDEVRLNELTSANLYQDYDYQSTKPTKVLPASQSTRVYDKVPVKALGQEIIGNRIVYSNYVNKHTAPARLNYSVNVSEKLPSSSSNTSRALEEYPEQTVKENRNYQVGVVLSDRYGRQSGVILAENTLTLTPEGGDDYGSSTIYSPYKKLDPKGFNGDSLKVLFSSEITSNRNPYTELGNPLETGEPGLYVESNGGNVENITVNASGSGYNAGTYDTTVTSGGSGTGLKVTITVVNGSINGAIVSAPGSGYNVGDIIALVGAGGTQGNLRVTSLLEGNPLGWYSYKIVVKQTEQEYYNVYVPDIISGNIQGSGGSNVQEENIAFISLISDNINKVPRGLEEVGPDQKQFSSDAILYPRVNTPPPSTNIYNEMFNATNEGSFVSTISTLNDLVGSPQVSNPAVYQSESNPLIAKFLTPFVLGKPYGTNTSITLGVLETEPVSSLINIYWETSTTGLISELNQAIRANGPNDPSYFENFDFTLTEFADVGTNISSTSFKPINASGQNFTSTMTLVSVIDDTGANRTSEFTLTGDGVAGYNVETTVNTFYYGFNATTKEKYTFNFSVTNSTPAVPVTKTVSLEGQLSNVAPIISSNPLPSTYLGMPSLIHTFTGVNGAFSGTSRDLSWTFENGLTEFSPESGVNFNLILGSANSGLLYYSKAGAFEATSEYTFNIVLTDAGGATDTREITINFIKGEFDSAQFTDAFNL